MLLDTHIWIRWLNEPTGSFVLPSNIIHHIEHAETLEISVMSCWELAKLVKRNRIATSIFYNMPLVSLDSKFPQYQELKGLLIQT